MSKYTTTWVNGCFDVLHPAHFELLSYAKSLSDYLIVGIDSDERIKQMKGEARPIHTVKERMYMLSQIKSVNQVDVFSSDDELEDRIKTHCPDLFVIGSEYRGKKIIGAEYAKQVIYFEYVHGYSSSNILSRL